MGKIVRYLLSALFISLSININSQNNPTVRNSDFYGMMIGNDTDISRSIPTLEDLGVKTVRLWADVNWSDPKPLSVYNSVKRYKEAGFNVILLFSAHNVENQKNIDPTAANVKSFFEWMRDNASDVFNSIDVFEISNEVNLEKYWKYDDPELYVQQVLKPAYEVLHAAGKKVLGASFTMWQKTPGAEYSDWGSNVRSVQGYVDKGYLEYCDYAGIHLYAKNMDELKAFVPKLMDVYRDKPIMITECNFKEDTYRNDHKTWCTQLNLYREYLASFPAIKNLCFYRFIRSSAEGGWPGFVLPGNPYTSSSPFYETYKCWPRSDDESNQVPTVRFISPSPNAYIEEGEKVTISVNANDGDGSIKSVRFFYDGMSLIGEDTDGGDGWSITINSIPVGSHNLMVIAEDNIGGTAGICDREIYITQNQGQGEVISINFSGKVPAEDAIPENVVVGIVPRKFWNNANADNLVVDNLKDDRGGTTTAYLEHGLTSNYQCTAFAKEGTQWLMRGTCARWDSNDQNITIGDIPVSIVKEGFDVYIYWANHDDKAKRTVGYTLNGKTLYLYDESPGWDGTFGESLATAKAEAQTTYNGKNYVVFRGIRSDLITIKAKCAEARGGVSAIQIVKTGTVSGIADSEWNDSKISLYPNPAVDQAVVSVLSEIARNVNIRLFTTQGVLVKNCSTEIFPGTNNIRIFINDLQPGMYYVNIEGLGNISSHKLIVK